MSTGNFSDGCELQRGRLVGYLRSTLRLKGRLCPIYLAAGSITSNSIFIQNVSATEEVIGFVLLDTPPSRSLVSPDFAAGVVGPFETSVGDAAWFGYELHDGDLIAGPAPQFRNDLLGALEVGRFDATPFAALEAAQFLAAEVFELKYATVCAQVLASTSWDLASKWIEGSPFADSVRIALFDVIRGKAGVLSTPPAKPPLAQDSGIKVGDLIRGIARRPIKGGYLVDFGYTGIRGFLPGSLSGYPAGKAGAEVLGKDLLFRVIKSDDRGNDVVVSRREEVEETRKLQSNKLLTQLKLGAVVNGAVTSITKFGAYVDIGGVEAFLHVKDFAWRFVTNPSDVLSVGEAVRVQILKVDISTGRVSVGKKQLQPDPWSKVAMNYPVGTAVTGLVTRIADYGVFVQLEPEIEGLLHRSQFSDERELELKGFLGRKIDVEVRAIDVERRRISLQLRRPTRDAAPSLKPRMHGHTQYPKRK